MLGIPRVGGNILKERHGEFSGGVPMCHPPLNSRTTVFENDGGLRFAMVNDSFNNNGPIREWMGHRYGCSFLALT